VLTKVVPNECPCQDIPRDQIADQVRITRIGNVVEPLIQRQKHTQRENTEPDYNPQINKC